MGGSVRNVGSVRHPSLTSIECSFAQTPLSTRAPRARGNHSLDQKKCPQDILRLNMSGNCQKIKMIPGSSTVEHSAVNRRVASSNVARGANSFNHLRLEDMFWF